MTRTITAIADRLVGLVVPKATASAGCSGTGDVRCYCSGPRLYVKTCTYFNNNCTPTSCSPCRYAGLGC